MQDSKVRKYRILGNFYNFLVSSCGQGACKDELNGYTCQCLAGFMGSHCDVNIDECASNPCNNR